MSREEFLGVLERIYRTISERAKEIEDLEIPEEIRPGLQEQLDIGCSGINLFMQGIDEMRLYAEDELQDHLEGGLSMVEQGNENLNLALEMARDNIRRLKEMDIDTSSTVV